MALKLIKSSKWRGPIDDIRTQFWYKNDVYPNDLTEAFEILEHHAKKGGKRFNKRGKQEGKNSSSSNNEIIQGVQYATKSTKSNEGGKPTNAEMTCFYCRDTGHYANECPLRSDEKKWVEHENRHAEGTVMGA